MHAATGTTTLLLLLRDSRGQPSVVESFSLFCAVSLNIIPPLLRAAVFRVSRVCMRYVPCVTRGGLPTFFFCRQSSVFVRGEAFFAMGTTTKTLINILRQTNLMRRSTLFWRNHQESQ